MKSIDLQKIWDSEKTIIFNGVVHFDGKLSEFLIRGNKNNRHPVPGRNICIEDLNESEIRLTEIDVLCKLKNQHSNVTVACGEGAFGADGFVYIKDEKNILWFAFFEESNPFISVEISNDFLIAKNNLDEIWKFPINSPDEFEIQTAVE